MLAVIDHLSGSGMFVGRSTPAQIAPLLQQTHMVTRLSQRASSRKSRQSSADHDDRK
jgi:hypothetical protein